MVDMRKIVCVDASSEQRILIIRSFISCPIFHSPVLCFYSICLCFDVISTVYKSDDVHMETWPKIRNRNPEDLLQDLFIDIRLF